MGNPVKGMSVTVDKQACTNNKTLTKRDYRIRETRTALAEQISVTEYSCQDSGQIGDRTQTDRQTDRQTDKQTDIGLYQVEVGMLNTGREE